MAHILLRSPYFLSVTTGSHLSAKLELTVDSTLRYTIIKNATSNTTVFEIASLTFVILLAVDYNNPALLIYDYEYHKFLKNVSLFYSYTSIYIQKKRENFFSLRILQQHL